MKRLLNQVKWRLFINVLLCIINLPVIGQQHDAQWVLGTRTSVIDFRNDTIKNYLPNGRFGAIITSANICDEKGELLYMTNGCWIFDSSANVIMNGTGLSPCRYTDIYEQNGLKINQGALFLPKPGSHRYYYLFHFSNDSFEFLRPTILYYSIIDREANFGRGAVVNKNIRLLEGKVLREGGMTACKHANGRDYWLIKGQYNSNRFFKFLITPDSILGPYIQSIGPTFKGGNDIEYSKFSQDGSKYITATYDSRILVMDFDRCSGEFSNPVTIYNNSSTDPIHHPISGAASVEFSPNSRFVYVSTSINLTQYDLWSPKIQDSLELYKADSNDFAQMNHLQLGRNGKLYASTWNGGVYFLHTVSKPDELGLACEFKYGSYLTLSANSANLPNMINYKLGPLVGSGCDTIALDIRQPQNNATTRIQPNPADKYVYVEMPAQGDYELQLLNGNGQLMDIRHTPQIDIFNTENLPAGIYFLQATDKQNGKQIAAQKVAVVH